MRSKNQKQPKRSAESTLHATTVLAFDGIGDDTLITFEMRHDESYIPQKYHDAMNQILAPPNPNHAVPISEKERNAHEKKEQQN